MLPVIEKHVKPLSEVLPLLTIVVYGIVFVIIASYFYTEGLGLNLVALLEVKDFILIFTVLLGIMWIFYVSIAGGKHYLEEIRKATGWGDQIIGCFQYLLSLLIFVGTTLVVVDKLFPHVLTGYIRPSVSAVMIIAIKLYLDMNYSILVHYTALCVIMLILIIMFPDVIVAKSGYGANWSYIITEKSPNEVLVKGLGLHKKRIRDETYSFSAKPIYVLLSFYPET